MTKEELKKEAIKFAVDYPTSYGKGYKHKDLRIAYLAGAESREKRIADLERKLEQTEKDLTDYQFNYPSIVELSEENATLKKENKTLRINQTNAVLKGLEMEVLKNSHRDRANNLQDQFTKAKELLKRYVPYRQITDSKAYKDLADETEQFLKE